MFNRLTLTERILSHLSLQEAFQRDLLGSDWHKNLTLGQVHLAIISELGELIDSSGFKWWTPQKQDTENMAVELIDLHHFLLIYALIIDLGRKSSDFRACSSYLQGIIEHKSRTRSLSDLACSVACLPLKKRPLEPIFRRLHDCGDKLISVWLRVCNYSLKQFDLLYRAKLKLNYERQDRGYWGDPSVKFIEGKEDNEVIKLILHKSKKS